MTSSYIFQIFLRVTVQNQIGIAKRVIVDKVIQLRPTFFDGSKGFVLFSKEYKKSEPFSYRKKVRILLLWCTSRDSNPGPTD